ncbi:MAG: TMEM14 family protein [Elainella sp.]
MDLATFAAVLYGGLAVAGGILGYLKARSQVSLISGLVSGLLLICSGIAHQQGVSWGQGVALVITVALIGVFGLRWFKTRKFMPAGLMVLAGLLALVGLIL